jgi:hypothetical protein
MRRFAWLPIASLTFAGCSIDSVGETQREQHSIELDSSPSTRVTLEMGAGELNVGGGATKLMEGEFTYNVDRLKPVIEHRSNTSGGELTISQGDTRGFAIGNSVSRWELRLNNGMPLDIVGKLGAGEAQMNLGALTLRGVDIGIGAGEVHVDLRGTPKQSYSVRINGGVGETVVLLPRTVGITAMAAGGLGTISVNGLEKRGDRWINAGHENDSVQITVDVKGGIGEIQVTAQ